MEKIIQEVLDSNRKYTNYGQVASYIPELKKAKRDDLGICIIDKDNNVYKAGNCDTKFTIQSVSKTIVLAMALMDNEWQYVFSKVGMEPSGDPFNSIMKLETNDTKKPCNPMINAGAIVTTSLIKGSTLEEREERMLKFFRRMARNENIGINYDVYKSEKMTGDRNRAMAYLLKNDGFIDGDVDEVLELYFKQCSIEIDAVDLARIGVNLASYGVDIANGERIISESVSRMVKTFMITCGMYDASGEFAIKVGIPAKSGVGGGIMASVPNKMGIGVYGPALDKKGNSIAGVKVLQDLSQRMNLNIF
ncbi:glutaminase A [Romboutsia lituseburensis]|uniref:Glutaminase n=1 Tax=Romboutsia lituseburensis DSM 797 TaxID=1121325 RepID=A0A1G9R1B3_9FIRM|nr:glutaminase A [Romboutsia lituseburensis]CEH35784.1 Glutaminase [Romboutsia lituseburensis]SDM17003.1 L-glutaminase [Romboutsia lituseburensis DSM 797]